MDTVLIDYYFDKHDALKTAREIRLASILTKAPTQDEFFPSLFDYENDDAAEIKSRVVDLSTISNAAAHA